LRDEGVLIFGSSNAVHNLHAYAWGRRPVEPYEWAVRFESRLRELIMAHDLASVVAYETLVRTPRWPCLPPSTTCRSCTYWRRVGAMSRSLSR
jgi:hypothetical protein